MTTIKLSKKALKTLIERANDGDQEERVILCDSIMPDDSNQMMVPSSMNEPE